MDMFLMLKLPLKLVVDMEKQKKCTGVQKTIPSGAGFRPSRVCIYSDDRDVVDVDPE